VVKLFINGIHIATGMTHWLLVNTKRTEEVWIKILKSKIPTSLNIIQLKRYTQENNLRFYSRRAVEIIFCRRQFKQEGHDGPYIAHLIINALNDKKQVVNYLIT
jgi:hypothetical protein